jgi:hypothetical protein
VTGRRTAGRASVSNSEVMMRKAIAISLLTALLFAVIGMWVRFGPVAGKSVTAAGVQSSTGAISPFELMSRSSTTLPSQYYRDPF